MSYEIVRLHDAIREEALKMLSDAFGTGKDFTKLFPRLLNAGTEELGQHYVALSEGKPCGFLSNVEIPYHVGKSLLKVSASGNVAVKSTERGKGLMGQMFDTVDAIQKKEGFDLVMLHGARVRYHYFGFELAGIEYRFEFHLSDLSKHFKNAEAYRFVDLFEHPELVKEATEIHNTQVMYAERKAEQFIDVLHSQVRKAVAVLKGDTLLGSLSYGAGVMDHFSFKSYENFAEILFAFMSGEKLETLSFSIPDGDKTLMKNCMTYCGGYVVGNPANFKILNFKKVVQAFLQLKLDNGGLCDGELTLSSDLFGSFRLSCHNGVARVEEFSGEPQYKLVGDQIYDFLFNVTPNRYGDYDPVAASWLPLPLFAPYMA